jgi:type II secretory pathway predicted ATPase ExeA
MIWRKNILDQLLEDINEGYHPLIIGPSQSGKTTLANQLIYRLQTQNNNIIIKMEAGSLATATEANVIDLFFKSTKECLENYRLNLSQSIDELNHIYYGRQLNTCYNFSEFLDTMYTVLHNIYRIVIIVDEIEILPDHLLYNILSLFRSLANKNLDHKKEDLLYSIVILCQQDLSAFDLGKGSPYNINAKTRRITDFTFDEFNQMLDQEHTGPIIGKTLSEEAIRFIYEETNGHPYLVQRICQLAIEIMNEKQLGRIDNKILIEALIILFEKGNRHLRIIGDTVPQNDEQKEIILNILRGIPEPFERIFKSHRYLEDKGVIKEDKEHKLCVFRTKIYERLFLKKYFTEISHITGKSLKKDARLLIRISEIQHLLINDEILKDLKEKLNNGQNNKNKSIKEYLNLLLKQKILIFNLEIIKTLFSYWGTTIDIDTINNNSILNNLVSLFIENPEIGNLKLEP